MIFIVMQKVKIVVQTNSLSNKSGKEIADDSLLHLSPTRTST